MGMEELAMVMDLAREVGVLLARRFEHHLDQPSVMSYPEAEPRIIPWSRW